MRDFCCRRVNHSMTFASAQSILTPNPRCLIATEIHREALANLQYALAGRKGITLLVGRERLLALRVLSPESRISQMRSHLAAVQVASGFGTRFATRTPSISLQTEYRPAWSQPG